MGEVNDSCVEEDKSQVDNRGERGGSVLVPLQGCHLFGGDSMRDKHGRVPQEVISRGGQREQCAAALGYSEELIAERLNSCVMLRIDC